METSIIHDSFKHGNNFNHGDFCVIEDDVVVGDDVKLGNYVMLKAGTRIGSRVDIADKCCTTGACFIGSDVTIRTGAIISKGNVIEDCCFVGPRVVTNHTKNVSHMRLKKPVQLVTYIGLGAIIGSQVSILAGVYIGECAIVGGGAVVVKDLDGYGVYLGCPAARAFDNFNDEIPARLTSGVSNDMIEHFRKYMPNIKAR